MCIRSPTVVAPVPATSRSDKARRFSRALCVAMLKRHATCPGAIVPRIRRELPVSKLLLVQFAIRLMLAFKCGPACHPVATVPNA